MAVSEAEITTLSRRLELGRDEFVATYTRRLRGGAVSLRERQNRDCIFYDRKVGCRVYEDRPLQCRTWPFWRSVVHSPERWNEEAAGCPGMNAGPIHDSDEITRTSESDGTLAARPRVGV